MHARSLDHLDLDTCHPSKGIPFHLDSGMGLFSNEGDPKGSWDGYCDDMPGL